ncbi:Piwi domain protein [Aphelenchoides bicaudatus]|nr:Piwi domain protein [Aphelenchoides bicaudatus]
MDRARRHVNARFANDSSGTINGKTSLYEIKIDPGRRIAYLVCALYNENAVLTSLKGLFRKTNGFGVKCQYVYDGKSTLFTNKKIQVEKSTRLFSDELKDRAKTFVRNQDVVVTIAPNESEHSQLDYSNLASALVSNVNQQADRSVRKFFEILTSQYLINQDLCQQVTSPLMDNIAQNKGIRLEHANLRGVQRTLAKAPNQRKSRRLVYPMEVLNVVPGQLVPTEKLSAEVGRQLLCKNTVPACFRYNYIQDRVKSLATGRAAQFLKEFGVKIDLQSNSVEIHQNKQPKIVVGDGKLVTAQPNVKDFVVQFMKKLILIGKHSGMTIEQPRAYCSVRNAKQLEKLFKDAPGNYDFIFHIDRETKLHQRLKIYEAYYKVLTQQICHKTMKDGQQTLKNIVMKLNAKRNGLCYVPWVDQTMQNYSLDNDDLLIIGYDVSHPERVSPKELFELKQIDAKLENCHPSVVGICANKLESNWAFAGDFFYQQTNQESVSPARLQIAVKRIVETASKNGRQTKRVVVFRDGISEGQFEMAIEKELPAIRQGIVDADPTLSSKITFIVATKNHNKRVFREKGRQITSSAIGDCVETKIVREDVVEFYLQSHSPVKGVSKMLQLSILVNENQMEKAEIRALIANLSNLHQICASPTSLPLPIFLADECRKRGMEIYRELYDMRFPAKGSPIKFAEKIKAVGQFLNYEHLTETLGYGTSHLSKFRFNA